MAVMTPCRFPSRFSPRGRRLNCRYRRLLRRRSPLHSRLPFRRRLPHHHLMPPRRLPLPGSPLVARMSVPTPCRLSQPLQPARPPPQLPLSPSPSPPITPPLPPAPPLPSAASSLDAAPPSAAAVVTLGGPDGRSDPLPLSQPLQPATACRLNCRYRRLLRRRSPLHSRLSFRRRLPHHHLMPPCRPPLPSSPLVARMVRSDPLPLSQPLQPARPPPQLPLVAVSFAADRPLHSRLPFRRRPPHHHLMPPRRLPLPCSPLVARMAIPTPCRCPSRFSPRGRRLNCRYRRLLRRRSPLPSRLPFRCRPAASSFDAAPPSAAAKLTLGGPDGRSDPLPLSQPLQPARPPPQLPLSPSPSPPIAPPLPPALPSPPAASSFDAALPPAAAKLTLGGPDVRSDPLPLSQPLQPARPPPQLPLSPSPSPPIAPPLPPAPPLPSAASSFDAAPPSTAAMVTLGDPGIHSDPLPSSQSLQPLMPPLQPPLPPYALPLPAPPASPTTPPPAAVPPPSPMILLSPDAAHTLPTVAVYAPVGQESPSDPLPPPQPLQPQTARPQPPPSLLPSPSTTPLPRATQLPLAASPDATPLSTTPVRMPSGPVAANDPLGGPALNAELPLPPRIPVDTDEGSVGVTNIHPPSTPAAPTAAPPIAAAADVARPLPAVVLAPGGLGERSEPLLPPPNPFTHDESLVGVTNIHPPSTAGPAPTAAPPIAAAADAAHPLPAAVLAPGGLAERSYPLLPSPIPLTHDEGLVGVTNIYPHSAAGPVPAAPTAAPPIAAAADAAHLLPAVALAPGGLAERSYPLLPSPIPLTHDEGLVGVTNIHPHSAAGPTPAAPTAAPPIAAAADAARPLPAAVLAPGGLAERSYPLLPSPIPLTHDEGLVGVTNIYPPSTAGPTPAAPTAAPPIAAAADAAHPLPAVVLAPGGLAERSDPLLPPPIPLTHDEGLVGVTNIHPHSAAGPTPAAPTAAPPIAAAADAAHPLPVVVLAPGGLVGRSHPLLSPPIPLTHDESLVGVTNIHPYLTPGSAPAAPAATPPIAAVDDAARPLPAVTLASVSPYESSDPLPQSLLPLSAPPSTGDGWRCRCRPY